MLFSTLPQLIALVILFFGGVILGLGLHPGGKKWRRRFKDESSNYAEYRRKAELHIREANRRIADLEGEIATLRAPADNHSASTANEDKSPSTAIPPEPVAEPVEQSWFNAGETDDLGKIRSVDAPLNARLLGLGVTRYEDITSLSVLDEMALEQRLAVPAGFITREQWRDQAALLHAGKVDEHAEQFPPR